MIDLSTSPSEFSIGSLADRTPVPVDDIISSGRTMIEVTRVLSPMTKRAPVCIGVHGLFAHHSDDILKQVGARLITCNTVSHSTNAIDVAPLLADAWRAIAPS